VDNRPVAIAQFAETPDKKICISLGLEYIAKLITSPHEMVTGAGIFHSQRSGHAVSMAPAFETVKAKF